MFESNLEEFFNSEIENDYLISDERICLIKITYSYRGECLVRYEVYVKMPFGDHVWHKDYTFDSILPLCKNPMRALYTAEMRALFLTFYSDKEENSIFKYYEFK